MSSSPRSRPGGVFLTPCMSAESFDIVTGTCVPRAMPEQIAVWQGDCNGYLVVDFSYLPRPVAEAQGPRTRPQRFQVLTGNTEGPSTPLVGLGSLRRRLQAALTGVLQPQGRYARKKTAAKKPRTARRSTKAKAKARTTRKKK